MKISIVIYGTRGDVQPMLALALELINAGHQVILCAPKENEELVKSYNCPFHSIGTSIKGQFEKNAKNSNSPKTQPSPKFMKQEISNQIEQLPEIIKDSDLILGVGYVLGLPTVAEYLKIPYRFVAFYPAILGASKNAPLFNRILWKFGKSIMNPILLSFINKKRFELKLNPIKDVWSYWMGEHVIIAAEPALNSVQEGVDFKFTQTGYMLLAPKSGLTDEVEKFLQAGPPPIFIGFGSNPIFDKEKITNIIVEVSKSIQQRFIISKGWAGLNEIEGLNNCLFVDDVPYELLFPRLSLIVHHGGTGTATSAAIAGIPQIIFPFMADQAPNQKQFVKLGISPKTPSFKKLSAKILSEAITECLSNGKYKQKSVEISKIIKNNDGIGKTMKVIEEDMKRI
jgi:vancomycin aglycone glucosyltransferase